MAHMACLEIPASERSNLVILWDFEIFHQRRGIEQDKMEDLGSLSSGGKIHEKELRAKNGKKRG